MAAPIRETPNAILFAHAVSPHFHKVRLRACRTSQEEWQVLMGI